MEDNRKVITHYWTVYDHSPVMLSLPASATIRSVEWLYRMADSNELIVYCEVSPNDGAWIDYEFLVVGIGEEFENDGYAFVGRAYCDSAIDHFVYYRRKE